MIARRKNQHLDLAAADCSQSSVSSDYERIRFIHNALPGASLDHIDLSTSVWGRTFSLPLMIGAMSGGTGRGDAMNIALLQAAAEAKIPFAIGSQRATLESDQTQRELRDLCSDAYIIGNLGGTQIIGASGRTLAQRAIDDIQANALMIHLNPLQEAMQPEGNRDWRGVSYSIEYLANKLEVPIFVKEVGAGLSISVIKRLYDLGVRTVETAGIGGTNWTKIEALRHRYGSNPLSEYLEWGVKTLDTLLQLKQQQHSLQGLTTIGSGGIRHGLDCAKVLWLGADMCAMAQPFLLAALDKGYDDAVRAVLQVIDDTRKQIELALFLTGNSNLKSFKQNAEVMIR